MNDLVSEYQQYQDATAEGKSVGMWRMKMIDEMWVLCFVEEGEGGEGEEEEHA